MNRRQRRASAKTRGRDAPRGHGFASSDSKLKEAVSYHQAGRLAEAKRSYLEILSRERNNAVALHLLGVIRCQEGDAGQAIELIGNAIALKPDYAEAHNNLGNALRDQGRLKEAVVVYRRALALKPDFAEAHNNLGNALNDQGKLEEAVAAYRRALELKLDFAEAHNNLGNALGDQGRLKEAVVVYRRALELKPDFAEAHSNLGNALNDQGKLEEAVAACRRALELKLDFAEAHSNLGNALRNQGKLEEAVAAYRRALELKLDFAEAHSNLIFTMNYDARYTPEEIFAESRDWDARHAAPRAERIRPLHNPPDPERRLRVGYVSPDFCAHPVSYFVEPLLAHHDRGGVEVFCYAEAPGPGF